jgi:hypothetical protein
MQVWSGLAVSAARHPEQDPAVMQAVIENFVGRLVLP